MMTKVSTLMRGMVVGWGWGVLAAVPWGLLFATIPARAAEHCDWRMDLPINLSYHYHRWWFRLPSGEPVVLYYSEKAGPSRLFTVKKEVTQQYPGFGYSTKEVKIPKGLTNIRRENWKGHELSITLGDTTITRKYNLGAEEIGEIIGDFSGSICLDVGYQYLLVEQPGMEPRRLVLLALLPKKVKIFDDDPCVAPEVWTDRERYVHMVAPDMSDFIKYDDHSFIISESGSSITFPYLVRIDKSMTSCGIDSKTLFLVDKELIDIARYAAWQKFEKLSDKGKKYARPIGALFYEEVYRRLHPLKKED